MRKPMAFKTTRKNSLAKISERTKNEETEDQRQKKMVLSFHTDGHRSWQNRKEVQRISKGEPKRGKFIRKDSCSTFLPGSSHCRNDLSAPPHPQEPSGPTWFSRASAEFLHLTGHLPPHQDWSEPKHISPISLLEQRTLCSRKSLCSLHPWRNSPPVKKGIAYGAENHPANMKVKKTLHREARLDSSYCKREASILGDVPVPGKDRRSTASTRGHAWPPEVPFFLWSSKSIRYIIFCKLLKNLQGKGRACCLLGQRLLTEGNVWTAGRRERSQCFKCPFTWLAVSWKPVFSR